MAPLREIAPGNRGPLTVVLWRAAPIRGPMRQCSWRVLLHDTPPIQPRRGQGINSEEHGTWNSTLRSFERRVCSGTDIVLAVKSERQSYYLSVHISVGCDGPRVVSTTARIQPFYVHQVPVFVSQAEGVSPRAGLPGRLILVGQGRLTCSGTKYTDPIVLVSSQRGELVMAYHALCM
jgi:hypothetical protein